MDTQSETTRPERQRQSHLRRFHGELMALATAGFLLACWALLVL